MAFRPDTAPNSRLFILAGKGINEDNFRELFEKYGRIDDFWIVKDRRTNDDKGVLYITFSKASEAALAMEEMNGRIVKGHPKPIKVLIANTKRDGSVRDRDEEEKQRRLFVIIPRSYTEEDLKKEFEKFGDVDSVNVLRDRDSGTAKGFGYVRFHRAYHAAVALEQCDSSYRPKFAEPKSKRDESARDDRHFRDFGGYGRNERDYSDHGGAPGGYPYGDRGQKRGFDDYGSERRDRRDDYLSDDGRSRYSSTSAYGGGGGGGGADDFSASRSRGDGRGMQGGGMGMSSPGSYSMGAGGQTPMEMIQDYGAVTTSQRLHVTAPLGLTQAYLTKLFNLIPGLEYCDLNEHTGVAYVRYNSAQCAGYAKDKLDQFEYPIGSRILVQFAEGQSQGGDLGGARGGGYDVRGGGGGYGGDNAVHQAAEILQKAGINPEMVLQAADTAGRGERVTYCNISLPLTQPLASEDSPVMQRLFIVCQPAAVSERILRDAFCRFGHLMDVYLLSGRNFGYAKYANKQSALRAMNALHGQNLAGQRLKVMEAEPQKDGQENKRMKTDESMQM